MASGSSAQEDHRKRVVLIVKRRSIRGASCRAPSPLSRQPTAEMEPHVSSFALANMLANDALKENPHEATWSLERHLRYRNLAAAAQAMQEGAKPELKMMMSAASRGDLGALKLLLKNGCPWDANVAAAAVNSQRLDILQWLHEHGCPWDEMVYFACLSLDNRAMARYAHEQGCPCDPEDKDIATFLRTE